MINWCRVNTVAFQTNYAIYNMQLYSFFEMNSLHDMLHFKMCQNKM